MCPVCIGSALLVLTGTGSAGGLALVAARVLGSRPQKAPAPPARAAVLPTVGTRRSHP
jgi:hypothetical protein